MPRPHRLTPRASAVIASAANVTNTRSKRPRSGAHMDWQRDAWEMFDTVGEYQYGVSWKAAACSRAELLITEQTPDGEKPVTTGPEVDALEILMGGSDQHAAMISRLELHREVSGESWIIGEKAGGGDVQGQDMWGIYSEQEVIDIGGAGASWQVDEGDGPRTVQDDQATVLRLWRPHPKRKVLAHSPSRAALPVLRVLNGLAQRQAASIDSRLAGNGVFLVPSEVSLPEEPWMAEEYPGVDPLLAMIMRTMTTAIQNPGSAAALAPIVMRVPGQYIEKAQHIDFATSATERDEKLLDVYLRRLALSLNMPPEILLGLADTNHWNAWQIDESAIKTHLEPDLDELTADLTTAWLTAAVPALGGTVNPARRINYNVDDLKATPDQSGNAVLLYDRAQLTGEALRKATNFDEKDAPKDDEVAEIIRRKQALNARETWRGDVGGTPAATEEAPPPVTKGPPPTPDQQDQGQGPAPVAAVAASCELLIARAVERANNKVHNRGKVRRPIPAARLDEALTDAWTAVPRTAQLLGVDAETLTRCLDQYTRAVLTEGTDPHQPRVLERVLTEGRVLTRGR